MPERETLEEEAVRRDRELSWTGADISALRRRPSYPYVHHIPSIGRLEAKKQEEEDGAQNMATLTVSPDTVMAGETVRLYGEGYDLKKSLTIKVYVDGDLHAEGGAILTVRSGQGILDGSYKPGFPGLWEFEVWQGQLKGKKRTEIVAEASVVVG